MIKRKHKPNRKALLELMAEYPVDSLMVASLLTVKNGTVQAYRPINGSDITSNNLELLKLKLSAKYDVI